MSDSDKTLINILWDGARLEKQFDENPYSLSASQLNILQMRKKFWQTFDGKNNTWLVNISELKNKLAIDILVWSYSDCLNRTYHNLNISKLFSIYIKN